MRRNEGPWDRIIRLVLGIAALIGAGAIGFSTLGGIIAIVVAAILIGTAAVGFCPLYALFNVRTNGSPARERDRVGAAS
jgi:hypothetical protein